MKQEKFRYKTLPDGTKQLIWNEAEMDRVYGTPVEGHELAMPHDPMCITNKKGKAKG